MNLYRHSYQPFSRPAAPPRVRLAVRLDLFNASAPGEAAHDGDEAKRKTYEMLARALWQISMNNMAHQQMQLGEWPRIRAAGAARSTSAEAKRIVRIASCNLHQGRSALGARRLTAAVADCVLRLDADVVLLQESFADEVVRAVRDMSVATGQRALTYSLDRRTFDPRGAAAASAVGDPVAPLAETKRGAPPETLLARPEARVEIMSNQESSSSLLSAAMAPWRQQSSDDGEMRESATVKTMLTGLIGKAQFDELRAQTDRRPFDNQLLSFLPEVPRTARVLPLETGGTGNGRDRRSALLVTLQLRDGYRPLTLVNVHLAPDVLRRRAQLKQLLDHLNAEELRGHALLVGGDWNDTDWPPAVAAAAAPATGSSAELVQRRAALDASFKGNADELERRQRALRHTSVLYEHGLHRGVGSSSSSSAAGADGFENAWHSRGWMPAATSWIGLPVDHFMHRDLAAAGVRLSNVGVLWSPNSDHVPVFVELEFG